MRKSIEPRPSFPPIATANDGDPANEYHKLVLNYLYGMRGYESSDVSMGFAEFLLYCTYVSRNASLINIDTFNEDYRVDSALDNLGNKYLATDFVNYYASLGATFSTLPDLSDIGFHIYDLSKALTLWVNNLMSSNLSFTDDAEGKTAKAISTALIEFMSSDMWGRTMGESASSLPMAELVVGLADVEGKSVLDFACGNGVYLSRALAHGASATYGRDISIQTVNRARILCFFANPYRLSDIQAANALTTDAPLANKVQRVVVAPPLNLQLQEYSVVDRVYYDATLRSLVGEEAPLSKSFEDFCIAKALASLEENGVAVLHVSPGFLFQQQKSRQAIRQSLVKGGYLQAVIELPSGCILNTSVKSAIIVIGKQPSSDGVLIVDASSKALADTDYFIKTRTRCELTASGIDWLLDVVKQRKEIPLVSTVVDRDALLSAGCNLNYSAYGSVIDYSTALDSTRSTIDIMADIKAAQSTIESLDARIAEILGAFEKEN